MAVGELRPNVLFMISETVELWIDILLALGELQPEELSSIYLVITVK